MAEGADHAGVTCDVSGCPHEGTNEVDVTIFDPGSLERTLATVRLCDRDLHAVHTAAVNFTIGKEG